MSRLGWCSFFTTVSVGGLAAGLGTYFAKNTGDTCKNFTSEVVDFVLSPITIPRMDVTMNGFPVHLTNITVNLKDNISEAWLNWIINLPTATYNACWGGTVGLTAICALIVLNSAGNITSLAMINRMSSIFAKKDELNPILSGVKTSDSEIPLTDSAKRKKGYGT